MKRIMSFLLAMVLLVPNFTVPASATSSSDDLMGNVVAASGDCGETVDWQLTADGTMTISGEGAMEDVNYWQLPWKDHLSSIKKVVVEEGVTQVGKYAFYNCPNLTDVTLADSVAGIGMSAFDYCTSLASVDLGAGITTIGMYCFGGCTALTSITIPATVKTISQSAFADCTNLAEVTFPEAAASMSRSYWAYGLTIGTGAFRNCISLTNVYLPKHLQSVDSDSFEDCKNLEGIWADTTQVLDSVEGPHYLSDSRGVVYEWDYDYQAKKYYPSRLTCAPEKLSGTYTINPDTEYLDFDFYGCSGLTELTIPSGAQGMNSTYAFIGCTSLAKINVGADNVDGFYTDAAGALLKKNDSYHWLYFVPVTNTTYTVSAEITRIQDGAFTGGTMKRIDVESGNAKYFSQDGVLYANMDEGVELLAYPTASTAGSFVVPDTVTEISASAFDHAGNLKDVWFGEEPVYVTDSYFEGIQVTCHYPDYVDQWGMYINESGIVGGGSNITWEPYSKLPEVSLVTPPTLKPVGNASSGKPKLSWAAVEGAEKYEIHRAATKNGEYSKVRTTASLSYTDSKAETGKTYYYKVCAVDAEGNASEFTSAVKGVCKLARPTAKAANAASSGKIRVTWGAVEGAAKYEVWRSTSKSGGYKRVKTTTSLSYTDSSAETGVTYYYKVRAIHSKAAANSADSTAVKGIRDLARPTVSIKLSSGDPKVSWKKIEGARKYEVWRATAKNGTYKKVKTTTSLSYTDTRATAGKTYYYKVVAVHSNTAANSAYSAVKNIKAK